jgi:hypothetical protein
MGRPRKPAPAMLFAGCLYQDEKNLLRGKKLLTEEFGPLSFESVEMDWASDYYEEELGSPIKRRFLFFEQLIGPGQIAGIKLKTNRMEKRLSCKGKRSVNIDPGYLTLHNVVLASTKNYAHRVYLNRGIYGETTLLFSAKEKIYKRHLFTYKDFSGEESIKLFLKAREVLKGKLAPLEDLEKGLE